MLRLEVLQGDVQGSTVLSGISVIGRGTVCSLIIDDRVVSREHAMIRPEDGVGFVIEDLDSRSGTFVNGIRTRKAVLIDGDTIKIGSVLMRVRGLKATQGEVPLDEVEMIKTGHLPTQRLSLDAVRFRTSRRYLRDSATNSLREGEPENLEETARNEGDDDDDDDVEPGSEVEHRLELLIEISNSLAAIHEPARLTRETAARILELFPQARRIGFFSLEDDPDGGDPVLRPTYLIDRSAKGRKQTTVKISHSVLESAISKRQAVLSEDVNVDPRFKGSESVAKAKACSIVCTPLCLGEKILGALYVDSTDLARPFDEGALRILTGISAILAAAFQNSRLFAAVQAETVRRASLERYFSPDLVERVMRGELPLAREGRLAQGTILFVDIRGFTRITLTTEPSVLVATLNAYFAAMQRIIFRTRGTVERFGGDSILAYWGIVDHDPQSSAHAIRAALAMQIEIFRLNPELMAAGRPRIDVGIGLNTGPVVVGDVGSAERYEFTILGDAVNMARRFESQAAGSEIIAGAATIRSLGRGVALHVALPPTTVKGKAESVEISAVFGLQAITPPHKPKRYDLAIPGRIDLGEGIEATIASGLEIFPTGTAVLEVLTPHDPLPETHVRMALRLPRRPHDIPVHGRVDPDIEEETLIMTPSLMVTGSGMQRIRVTVADPQRLLHALGILA